MSRATDFYVQVNDGLILQFKLALQHFVLFITGSLSPVRRGGAREAGSRGDGRIS